MRFSGIFAAVTALCSTVTGQYTAKKYYDAQTGITFASITHDNGVTYRVAMPITPTDPAGEAILQVIVPSTKFGWCGLAWAGHMTNNPLSVNWGTKSSGAQKGIVSSRMAFYYQAPGPYAGASYSYLKGTTANSTHFSVMSYCRGCTRWNTSDGYTDLHQKSSTQFAYACSSSSPSTPTSNTSSFTVHDQNGIWTHDLSIAKNASFASWVQKNPLLAARDALDDYYL